LLAIRVVVARRLADRTRSNANRSQAVLQNQNGSS